MAHVPKSVRYVITAWINEGENLHFCEKISLPISIDSSQDYIASISFDVEKFF